MTGGRAGRAALATAAAVALGLLPCSAVPAQAASCAHGTERRAPVQTPWAQASLGLDALATGFQGRDVRIAVIGSGVDADHPQLRGHVGPGTTVSDAGSPLDDCLGFGTAAAGAAAAAPVSGLAVRGAAPQALLVPVRLPDWTMAASLDDKQGAAAAELFALAVGAAVTAQADVAVLPSIDVPATQEVRQALSDAVEKGVLLVQGGPASASRNSYPFSAPEVLGVVAHDRDGRPADDAAEAGEEPQDVFDLAAPGIGVMVLTPGTGYSVVTDNGTAAGYVAGVAAVLKESGAAATPAALRELLLRTAETGGGVFAVPVVSPAAALGPGPGAGAGAVGAASSVVPGSPVPGRGGQAAGVVALTSLGTLTAVGILAAAHRDGRRRRWRPADPVDPAQIIQPPVTRSI